MKFKGTIIGEASGSMNGLTFSHNRYGQYIRVRAVPVNPASTYQQALRSTFGVCAARWSNTLTPAQRTNWESYAAAVPHIDPLGAAHFLTGLNWYIALNVLRVQAGGSILNDAPTIYLSGELTTPTIVSATAATEVLSIGFTNTDGWAGEIGGKLLVFCSPPMQPSRNFYNGPFRYSGMIAGAVVPPTSPLPITSAFPFAVGNRIYAQFRAVRADGRASQSFRNYATGI